MGNGMEPENGKQPSDQGLSPAGRRECEEEGSFHPHGALGVSWAGCSG